MQSCFLTFISVYVFICVCVQTCAWRPEGIRSLELDLWVIILHWLLWM